MDSLSFTMQPTPSQRIRVYLSYPMTKATPVDKLLRNHLREGLKRYGAEKWLDVYDPENDEPEGAPLEKLQELDYQKLKDAALVIFVLGPGTESSKGQLAEMEWARRCFGAGTRQVLLVGDPNYLESKWTRATCRPWPLVRGILDAVHWLRGWVVGRGGHIPETELIEIYD